MSLIRPLTRGLVQPLTRGIAATRGGGKRDIDLFVIVGQSNADGRGDYTTAPASPNGIAIIDGVITDPLVDPLGATSQGDMWAAFSNTWFSQEGRKSAFVPAAVGNSALLAAADAGSGNWSPTGTLRAAAVTAANAAIAALNGSADYALGNVYFVCVHGERDAESNNGTTITATLYEQAQEDLADYFKAQVPQMVEMLVVQLGNDGVTASRDAQYALYRQAQANACADSAILRMVCTAGMSMSYRTPQWKEDGLHYDQNALNQLGAMAAWETADPDTSLFAPNLAVTVDNYTGAAIGSRTIAHTCPASCKTLVVAASIGRTGSTTTNITSATFNGKTMRLVQKAGSTWGTAPASLTQSSIWILDEDDYGGALDGASGNIVLTFSSTTVIFASVTRFDSEESLVIESQQFGSDTSGTVASIAKDYYANSPCLQVTCVSGRVNADTPATWTFSAGTEATDYGYFLDTGRSFSTATAYQVKAAPVYGETVTATPSAALRHAGIVVASFRKRFNGETDVS